VIDTMLAQYKITAQIGRGGMGEVWKAIDTRLGREVAIKTLPAELSKDKSHLARFAREARAASALNHPNICIIYDLDEQDGRPFIVMELMKGRTLKEELSEGPLSMDDVLNLGIQMADGLEAAHRAGIVHRDLKPANVFVTERGQAKILDFGLARQEVNASDEPTMSKEAEGLTVPGTTLGTVAYMSPEQACGETLDTKTDLFSLGVLLYEMACGRPAFGGTTTALIFDGILHKTPDPLTRVKPWLPEGLDTIVGGLLEKDRKRRPSAGEVLKDLKRLKRELDSGVQSSVSTTTPVVEKKSIVVLPFENLSADADNEYFSDGLTDEIITDLSQLEILRVISRSSSMQLKGSRKDVGTLAHELNVQYVLEGSVRRAGPNVRVTAQLIDAANDAHLWADKFMGKTEDIFDIQETISRSIVDALKVRLSPQDDKKFAARPIDNIQAFECYHRARYEIYKFTREGLDRALGLIQAGLRIVGENELFYASMGIVYWQYVNAALTAEEGYLEKAEECARKAFQLNQDSAVAHELRGLVQYARGQRREAVESLERALSLDPNSPYAQTELMRIFVWNGRAEEGWRLSDQRLAADPLDPVTHLTAFANGIALGNPERHRKAARDLLETIPDFVMLRAVYSLYLLYKDRLDEARRLLDATPDESVPTVSSQTCTFLKHALAGRRSAALSSFTEDVKAAARRVEFWSWYIADCYTFIDERELALDWIENAVDRGCINYPFWAKHNRIVRRLDGDPRFEKLLEKVKREWDAFAH
jgi:serine/threonine protein kinase